jgi:hypothetical protein
MDKTILDLYSDYLLASSGPVTATGLAALLDNRLSHDAVTRFLGGEGVEASAKEWWLTIKPLVRRAERQDGVLLFDDTIIEKPHTDENAIVCWHFDQSKGRLIKGINLLTALYQAGELSLPVAFELVEKLEWDEAPDEKGCWHRRSATTKNERLQRMLRQAVANGLRFGLVLADVWYASAFEHAAHQGRVAQRLHPAAQSQPQGCLEQRGQAARPLEESGHPGLSGGCRA